MKEGKAMLFRQKRWTIVVAVLCLPLSVAFGAEPGQQTCTAGWTDTPPVLDGVLGEGEYSAAIPVHVTFEDPTTPPGISILGDGRKLPENPDDLSYTIYAMYDAENLYIAVDVVDDIVIKDGVWDDVVEIFIDGDDVGNDHQAENPGNEGFQLLVDTGGDAFTAHSNFGYGTVPGFYDAAAGLQARGYVVEFVISLSWIDVIDGEGEAPPGPGSSVGFNVAVDDDDDGGPAVEHYGAWDGSYSDWKYSREDDWGTLHFELPPPTSSASSTWGQIKNGMRQ